MNGDSSRPDNVGDAPARRIHEIVLWRIEEQIASGRLTVGDRLPSERDLAASLGVSRPAVREAIRMLEAIGTVVPATAEPDSVALVAVVPGDALTHLVTLHVMLSSFETTDVVRARIALERESARLAAKQATIADHTAMADDLAAMDQLGITPEEFNDRDTAFHLAIARASGNVLLTELTTARPVGRSLRESLSCERQRLGGKVGPVQVRRRREPDPFLHRTAFVRVERRAGAVGDERFHACLRQLDHQLPTNQHCEYLAAAGQRAAAKPPSAGRWRHVRLRRHLVHQPLEALVRRHPRLPLMVSLASRDYRWPRVDQLVQLS
ncbi:MAG TPA: GntR family transcriptional regulator [Micromonosporaceae bacterium]|nr:GntR family transcriptional regulator [Micromonosporaceae bacterium]